MTTDARSLLERYQPYRRFCETGFWILYFVLQASLNSVIVELDVERVKLDFATWEPVVWEWSSNLVLLALVPAVIAFERRFPLYIGSLRKNLPWHFLASLVFSVVHVTAMVGLRKLAYSIQGGIYDFGYWPRELGYEYLKDWRSYLGILLIAGAYNLLLVRLQGEARLLDAPDEGEGPALEPIDRPERFLVRKLGKEFLVAANDIEVLQASGNYVNLRVRGREYPLRATMAGIEPRMDPARFVRVHRSYMVNLDCLAEIEPLETGDARLVMRDGTKVPCSRRYRSVLKR
ncbi:MAG TPA: LytTR family DNA-binding domain-containing protein [Arenimonas sp.]|uniref:LytTR family DNA-binding domain-containing protein n=1 Tax=Arenimonas sp. TaxID=1872635 RepID=UPI002BBCE810|nr:LytTR family DNA-binding domain-containing protein [Arenimonas sp.]HMB56917.1 LytTR family DNA-binding domain-containing protein [Arenimonas sp.]